MPYMAIMNHNDDEFILTPPSLLANTVELGSRSRVGLSRKKLAEFKIIQPDHTLHSFLLPVDSLGIDCIEHLCDVLGIAEKDYFGLYHNDKDSGYRIWINKRLQIRKQLKTNPPHVLNFAVKYYTQPNYLLQTSTIQAFFTDLKCQIRRGDIHIPNNSKAIIGARLAQADLGDIDESQGMLYSPYFPSWNSGIAHIIRKEHKKLIGVGKREAYLLLIQAVYELENYGMTYVRAIVNDEQVIVGIGARFIRLFTTNWRCKSRISFGSLTQVAFGCKFFSFMHLMHDGDRNTIERKVTAYVYNHTLAKSLFRMVTEDQVFHYQPTVTPVVTNHADNRETIWRGFCRKVLKKTYIRKYYYDIERTKREAYRYNWQVLNQVTSDTPPRTPPDEPPVIFVNLSIHQEEEGQSDASDSEKTKKKCEVWWGLSNSSTNLAKELLPSEYVTLTPSKELSFFEPQQCFGELVSSTAAQSLETSTVIDSIDTDKLITKEKTSSATFLDPDKSRPLSREQGRKMFQFLMKIQDEKLCNVCMDELISSVFCPCGHYVACAQCAQKLDKCPVCRQPIGYVQFVYTKSS